MRRTIALNNDFHKKSTVVRVNDENICAPVSPAELHIELTKQQVKRAERKLCGIDGCQCGKITSAEHVGERGNLEAYVISKYDMD